MLFPKFNNFPCIHFGENGSRSDAVETIFPKIKSQVLARTSGLQLGLGCLLKNLGKIVLTASVVLGAYFLRLRFDALTQFPKMNLGKMVDRMGGGY